MAKFTEYLPTTGGGKPITQDPKAPDYVGQAANMVSGFFAADSNRKKTEAAATKAANEAQNDAALDELARGAFGILTKQPSVMAKEDVMNAKSLADRRDAEAISGTNFDISLNRLVGSLMRKYPTQSAELFKELKTLGLNHYMFNEADDQQAVLTAGRDAMKAQIGSYVEAAADAGYTGDTSYMFNVGRELVTWNSMVAQRKADVELSSAIATKDKTLVDTEIAVFDLNTKRDSRELVNGIIGRTSVALPNLIDRIAMLTGAADGSAPNNAAILEQGPLIMAEMAQSKARDLADAALANPDDVKRITDYYTQHETMVKSMLSGDLSFGAVQASKLKILKDSNLIEARNLMPAFSWLNDVAPDAFTGDMVMRIMNQLQDSNGTIDTIVGELAGALNKDGTPQAESGMRFVQNSAELSRDPSAILEMNAADARKQIVVRGQILPRYASTAADNPTPENLTLFSEAILPLLNAGLQTTDTNLKENFLDSVAKNFATTDVINALKEMDKVDPETSAIIRKKASFLLKQGLNAGDRVISKEGDLLSKGNTSVVNGQTITQTPITYNEVTGRYDPGSVNPGDGGQPYVAKRSQMLADQMNTTLNALYVLEYDRDRIGKEFKTPLAFRNYLATMQLSRDDLIKGDALANEPPMTAAQTAMSAAEAFSNATKEFNTSLKTNLLPAPVETGLPKVTDIVSGIKGVDFSMISPNVEKFLPDVIEISEQYGVPAGLVVAVMDQESRGRPDAVSHMGATGLMQLMPSTASDMGVQDATNPRDNIGGGVKYLGQMLERYDGDITNALMAYNWGPGNVDKWRKSGSLRPVPEETSDYVIKVMRRLGYELEDQS